MKRPNPLAGFTLLELVIFILVLGIALVGVMMALNRGVLDNVRPMYQVRALELAQAQMDQVLGRRFDENTLVGGIPSCVTSRPVCTTTLGLEGGESLTDKGTLDEIDDHHNYNRTEDDFQVSVSVVFAGDDLPGLSNASAKRVTVRVTPPFGNPVTLSVYRTNY